MSLSSFVKLKVQRSRGSQNKSLPNKYYAELTHHMFDEGQKAPNMGSTADALADILEIDNEQFRSDL